jgi:biotin carboxyl carrier protein
VVYVLILVFGFLDLYNYENALRSLGESFFSITLLALVYEFVIRKKSDLIPPKARELVEKLDLKKIVAIWGVVILILFAKQFFTSMSSETQYGQEEETTEEVIEEEAPAPSQVEEQVQEQEEESSYAEPSPAPAAEAAPAAPQKQAVQLYSIQDPDGYTNLRATPGGTIIRKVYENETFELVEAGETYSKIKLKDGTTGFLHNSRIAVAK